MSDDYAKEGKRVKSVIERRQAAMREAMGEEDGHEETATPGTKRGEKRGASSGGPCFIGSVQK
jgi:hypothetical protein